MSAATFTYNSYCKDLGLAVDSEVFFVEIFFFLEVVVKPEVIEIKSTWTRPLKSPV